jgi:hypothetical protein
MRNVNRRDPMKTLMTGVAVSLAAIAYLVPARSDAQPITCWYNDGGKYTGADSGTGMPVGKLVKGKGGGDYAWGYTIEAPDGTKCPRKRPGH